MSAEPLATIDDLNARLGRTLTGADEDRAYALLADASAAARLLMGGQVITAVTGDTIRVKVRNGLARLPQRPVTAVTAVTTIDSAAVPYRWNGIETVRVLPPGFAAANGPDYVGDDFVTGDIDGGGGYLGYSGTIAPAGQWPHRQQLVDITYDHGYTEVPDAIVGIVCQAAGRGFGRKVDQTGTTQQTITGYSEQFGSAAASGGFGFLQAEKDALAAFGPRSIGSMRIG